MDVDTMMAMARRMAATNVPLIQFRREIFGRYGVMQRLTDEQRAEFFKSPEFGEMMKLVDQLHRRQHDNEPTRTMTVRMPRSDYSRLKLNAAHADISMNRYVVLRLLEDCN